MKCDYVLFDILRKIDNTLENVEVKIVVVRSDFVLPLLHNKKNRYDIIYGPLMRAQIFELMQNSDIYVDTSCSEGFGLTALESMAAGCIPIVSDSFGVSDYLVNSKNGLLVKEINNADVYLEKIRLLMDNDDLRKKLHSGMAETVKKYDFESRISQYELVFCEGIDSSMSKPVALGREERALSSRVLKIYARGKKYEQTAKRVYSRTQRMVRRVGKIMPKPVRITCIKMIEFLRSCY